MTALASLVSLRSDAALDAVALIHESSSVARVAGGQALRRVGEAGFARLDAIAADPATQQLLLGRPSNRSIWPAAPRTLSDYRAIVERWIVPD
jgi:hypothetical protein